MIVHRYSVEIFLKHLIYWNPLCRFTTNTPLAYTVEGFRMTCSMVAVKHFGNILDPLAQSTDSILILTATYESLGAHILPIVTKYA